MKCPSCGNENRPEATFCDACGTRLAQPQADGPPAPEPASSVPARLPEGVPRQVAGHLEMVGFIGRAGRKDVFLARDLSEPGKEVAVALFNTAGLGETALARARREMQAMERLGEHPHLVPVFETGEQDGRAFIVSDYMAGGDVKGLLAAAPEGRLEVERALGIGIDVCRALEHAHACGIVHRDLKPGNVWLDTDGRARLGDFGLAATGPGRGGGMVGTVAYLPPEQALGRTTGPRADLYSLGVMLYEMVCGQPPFTGGEAVAVIGQHLSTEPVAPSRHNPAVPHELDLLIAELLAKSPTDRPESAAAVRERLEQIRDAPAPAADTARPPENPLESLAGGVFVGREGELSELCAAADEALGGRAQLVLLAGEPGIGKTRTAEEVATFARVRGANVHWGRCLESEGAPPYWPWVQAIRSYAREADPVALAWEMGAGAAEIARVVPEVAERVGERDFGAGRGRAVALPVLRRDRDLPRQRLRVAPAGRRPRRPALGGRALAAAARVHRPRALLLLAAADRHLPRRRAGPPPPALARARRALRAGSHAAGSCCAGSGRRRSPPTSSALRAPRPRPPWSPRCTARPRATRSSSARWCACWPARARSTAAAATGC